MPRRFRLVLPLVLALTAALLAGSARISSATPPQSAGLALDTPARASTTTYAVGLRTVRFQRGKGRPLQTLVWYPAAGRPGTGTHEGAAPAPGTFPLIVFSHGLGSLPLDHGQTTTKLAEAGFIVAAPAYPRTNKHAGAPVRADIPNQPLDASTVITKLLRQDRTIDRNRIAAMGHSAGGTTTTGLLNGPTRDERVTAGVVIAGRPLGYPAGPAAPVLFIHGDADPVVTYDNGRTAYDRVTSPKAFLTLLGGDHGSYLGPGSPGNAAMVATVIDFLRWALYGDAAARGRLDADARDPGVTRFENRL